jgi:hypothetical protein
VEKTAKSNKNQAQGLRNLLSPAQVQEDMMDRY